jgi:hypothetical protein
LPRSALGVAAIVLDEVARPLFRPLLRAFGRLRLVEGMERCIAGLPAYRKTCFLAHEKDDRARRKLSPARHRHGTQLTPGS